MGCNFQYILSESSIFEKIYYWLDRKFEASVNLEFSRFANRIISSCKFSTGTKFSMQESYYIFFSTSTVNDLNLVCMHSGELRARGLNFS